MRIPYLARQEHWITLPSHLIPSRPRDAENQSSPHALGLEIASKSNPLKIVFQAQGVVSPHPTR